jgi:quinohemoprotein amine dehydrogenase alpha subunit-like protein
LIKEKIVKKNRFFRITHLIIFTIVGLLLAASSQLGAQEENIHQGLAPGEGRDLVLGNCTVCHSASIILQNHMSREAWDKTITWMQKEQGMWELEKSDRKIILDYLSTAQGLNQKLAKENPGKRKNPMYEFDYQPNPF